MGNHVMYDCGAWFLYHVKFAPFVFACRQWRSKNMTSRFASLTKQVNEKIVEDKDSQNTKRSMKVAKELFADYMKEKKTERTWRKERVGTNFENIHVKAQRKEFV